MPVRLSIAEHWRQYVKDGDKGRLVHSVLDVFSQRAGIRVILTAIVNP